jgi:cytochrome c oxidase subunit 1
MHKGSIDTQTPFYWAMGFIFVFMVGGFSGLVLGSLAANVHLHNTHFVLAHFHFIVFGGTGFAFFGAMHYWFPKMTGRMYDTKWANIGLLFFFIGFITIYGPMFYLGVKGMPRRYFDYDEIFHAGNIISSMGAWVLYAGALIIVINLFSALKNGARASANPWGGKTLEWTIPSPPPTENFEEQPIITKGPYDYKLTLQQIYTATTWRRNLECGYSFLRKCCYSGAFSSFTRSIGSEMPKLSILPQRN